MEVPEKMNMAGVLLAMFIFSESFPRFPDREALA